MCELKKALQQNSNATALDPAGLPPAVMAHLSENFLFFLLKFYNFCFFNDTFPLFWKFQKLIILPKNLNDLTLPTSYRPISLTHLFSKLYEKIISNRIIQTLMKYNKFAPTQFGGLPKKQTMQPIVQLIDQIKRNQNHMQHTHLIVYDISKAFDSIWREALRYKLKNLLGFEGPILWLFITYFTHRTVQLHHNHKCSDIFITLNGAPQGTCFGLLTYILYTNDLILLANTTHTVFLAWVDDTILFNKYTYLTKYQNTILQTHQEILQWTQKWKLCINIQKTNYMTILAPILTINTLPPTHISHHTNILPVTQIKYLGLIIDQQLNFNEHTNLVKNNLNKAQWAVYKTYKDTYQLRYKCWHTFYQTIFLSNVDYCGAIYLTLCKDIKSIKQKLIYHLQTLLNVPRKSVAYQFLHYETYTLNFEDHIEFLQLKLLILLFHSSDSQQQQLMQEFYEICQRSHLNDDTLTLTQQLLNNHKDHILTNFILQETTNMGIITHNETEIQNTLYLATHTINMSQISMLDHQNQTTILHIAVDAGVYPIPLGPATIGMCVHSTQLQTFAFYLGDTIYNICAELYAIYFATLYIYNSLIFLSQYKEIKIYTDAYSVSQMLQIQNDIIPENAQLIQNIHSMIAKINNTHPSFRVTILNPPKIPSDTAPKYIVKPPLVLLPIQQKAHEAAWFLIRKIRHKKYPAALCTQLFSQITKNKMLKQYYNHKKSLYLSHTKHGLWSQHHVPNSSFRLKTQFCNFHHPMIHILHQLRSLSMPVHSTV